MRAAIVFAASFAAYLVLLQSEPWGDGITYLVWLRDEEFLAHHLFYLPPLWCFARGAEFVGVDERTAGFAFSAFCAAGGNAVLTWLLARSRQLARACTCPLRLAFLLATTPSLVFFGTQIENHAHHYLWICVTLFTLDRALDHARSSRLGAHLAWLGAGLAVLAAFSSHSTSILLWPALAVAIWTLPGEGLWRAPRVLDVRNALLFFGPAIAFKLLQPSIKVWISGDPNWGSDTTADFALSLLDWRSLSTWVDYSWSEVLVPAWGLIWAVLVLGLRRIAGHRSEALVLGLAFLPYFAFFGSWNVREYGAYYLALLPVFVIAIARLTPRLRREEAIVLLALTLGQAVHASIQARSWAEKQTDAAWNWARDAAELAEPGSTILCWEGVRWLHLDYDHADRKLDVIAFHNWTVALAGLAEADPQFWAKVADDKLVSIVGDTHKKGGRVYVARELVERIRSDASLERVRPIVAKLESIGWDEVERGAFRGWVLQRP